MSPILPNRWLEVLNGMEKTVAHHLATEAVPAPPASPPPAVRPIPLIGADNVDAALDQADRLAAEIDEVLQGVAADFTGWLNACRETEQRVAASLDCRIE